MKCEKLDVWKRAVNLSSEIYKELKYLNDFGFKNQITRASLSIASNIAEGVEKNSDMETIRYLDIAKGSIAELTTQIYIGINIDYINSEKGKLWIAELENLGKMLSGFIRSLKSKSNV